MRILHVISGLPKAAGTSVFCMELCNYLEQNGVACCIAVCLKNENDIKPSSLVPVFEVATDPSSLSFKPDIVHIHALWDPFLHRFATWSRKNWIPLVFSPHGMLTPWALKQKPVKKGLALALYQYRDLQSAALLHATAASEVEDIRRLGLRPPVIIAPLGVYMPAEPPPIRRNLSKIALFVSRIHPKKGLLNLVEAWALLKNRGISREPWHLVIAGPDQDGHAAELKRRAKKLGLCVADIVATQLLCQPTTPPSLPDIVFTGPVYGAEKDNLYRMADLFVLPTYSENFGAVVIEALAHGCPVITTKGTPWQELQGCPEIVNGKQLTVRGKPLSNVQHEGSQTFTVNRSRFTEITATGRCGWWIDIGVDPLVQALCEAMSLTDEERAALGENGKCLVQAKYTWPAIGADMRQAYDWILTGGLSPAGLRI